MNTLPTPTLLTAPELAERWSTSLGGLANDRSAGRGLPFLRLGSRVRYRLSDVEAYESANLVAPVAS